jgi:hypothetical protein
MPRNSRTGRGQGQGRKSRPLAGTGRWRRWLIVLLLVAALIVAALHFGDLEKFAELAAGFVLTRPELKRT